MQSSRFTLEAIETIDRRRRSLLADGMRVWVGATLGAAVAHAATCADPEELTGAQLSLRKTAEYRDSYPDEKQTCRHCQFFRSREGDCGNCRAIGGPVSGGGHCNSWSERPETK